MYNTEKLVPVVHGHFYMVYANVISTESAIAMEFLFNNNSV